MTLVMYIPYKEGCILISDRQDTEEVRNGICKREVKKLYLVSEKGPAIGCSGDTELFLALFEKLRHQTNVNNDNVCDTIVKLLLELAKQWKDMYGGIEHSLENIEMFVVTWKNGIIPYHLHGILPKSIDRARCHGIGTGYSASGPLLNPSTTNLSDQEVIALGEEIMRQVARLNYTVGPPEYHGYDIIKVSKNGKFITDSKPPTIRELDFASIIKELGRL